MESWIAEAGRKIMERCDHLAEFSEAPDGLTRRFLTPCYRQAIDLVAKWMTDAGMQARTDAAGNLIGRYEGRSSNGSAILLGSHIDTVVDAGRYDGMLGVLSAIACVERLRDEGQHTDHPIEVIVFGDEEGARFEVAMIGSRAFAGTLPQEWLECCDEDGISLGAAYQDYGLDPAQVRSSVRDPDSLHAYLEVHIEQGTRLELAGRPVAAVSRIRAVQRARLRFVGAPGHAGTVAMADRRDALTGMAELVLAVEALARRRDCIATVGAVEAKPGAVNIIAGSAVALLDIRADSDEVLTFCVAELDAAGQAIAERRNLTFESEVFYRAEAAEFSPELVRLAQIATGLPSSDLPPLVSGAGHDAAVLAPVVPAEMLFVRCRNGVSHAPEEAITAEDAAEAVAALLRLIWLVDASGAAKLQTSRENGGEDAKP